MPIVDMLVVGKDISVDSNSFCQANMSSKLVIELFCVREGNPHDMGTRDACAGAIRRVSNTAVTNTAKTFFSLIRHSSKYS